MANFNFEKNLPHQLRAVNDTLAVFDGLEIRESSTKEKYCINPVIDYRSSNYYQNIKKLQTNNEIEEGVNRYSNIVDIMMETGTGKTYTYTKTIFELNKQFGIFKFVIVVPTLPIKAGTINFLESDSSLEHFREQYGKTLELHIVESPKSKNKKSYLPSSINAFVNAENFQKNRIQVMIINAGMINSETMQKSFERSIFDQYSVPFDAISAIKPFLIIDEPHKFSHSNKTWSNIQKLNPQFILRYGATFPDKEITKKDILGQKQKILVKDYHNLIHTLTAVDSFGQNLVKGVIGHITEFKTGENTIVKFINSDSQEATFELTDGEKNGHKSVSQTFKITKKESLEKIHFAMSDLYLDNLNLSTAILSNGLELKKGDKINPFSYSQTLQESMIFKTIDNHFQLEKQLLTREVRIKPLTLFFIDNIEEYRSPVGNLRLVVERCIQAKVEELLKTEEVGFYRDYLLKTLENVSKSHGGYFSKDNDNKDESIQKEVEEILHDKKTMLNLDNPRRFIFSKWTLREGWDNPNVFQICKLRSSGSDISKLQEVGRGLRLPVNEYGNRVKDEQFYLNYFVDFTENNFIDKLVGEINAKSGAISIEQSPEKISDQLIKLILQKYPNIKDEDELIDNLVENKIIRASHKFLDGGFDYIKSNYPLIFDGIGTDKIRKEGESQKKIKVRVEKYQQLKELWEKLNQKVILEYKIENESKFQELLIDFLNQELVNISSNNLKNKQLKIEIHKQQALTMESIFDVPTHSSIPNLKYSIWLKQLARALNTNLVTLHKVLGNWQVNQLLNTATINNLREKFNSYLVHNAIDSFAIEYKSIKTTIHPTILTDKKGNPKKELESGNIGTNYSGEKVAESYIFDQLFYDSNLEKQNITTNLKEITVFTKIPKNSIKIPVAGGGSYSPDFGYVLNYKDGNQKLYFVVETKNADSNSIRDIEKQKIKHAEQLFGSAIKIQFKTQFQDNTISDLIKSILQIPKNS